MTYSKKPYPRNRENSIKLTCECGCGRTRPEKMFVSTKVAKKRMLMECYKKRFHNMTKILQTTPGDKSKFASRSI